MTRIGKLLVMLNLVISVMMAFWAVGVYTNSVEWIGQKGTTDLQQQVAERRDQIAPTGKFGLWDSLTAAEARWKAGQQAFQAVFPYMAENRKWYTAQKDLLLKSKEPLLDVVSKDGLLVLDEKIPGRPVLVQAKDKFGEPLVGLETYTTTYDNQQMQLKAAADELAGLVKEDDRLTLEIGGPGGLRDRLAREDDKHTVLVAEQKYLEPLVVNSRVEGELLLKRKESLEARVKLLEKTRVAVRDRDR